MIHGRFSLHGSSKLSGAIPAVIFGGIAPIADVVCARPSTEVECVFVHFQSPLTSVRNCSFSRKTGMGYLGAWKESSFC